ncbi:MAG: hypothetical protein AABX86_00180 [Nanoarchaeota archaeon]
MDTTQELLKRIKDNILFAGVDIRALLRALARQYSLQPHSTILYKTLLCSCASVKELLPDALPHIRKWVLPLLVKNQFCRRGV